MLAALGVIKFALIFYVALEAANQPLKTGLQFILFVHLKMLSTDCNDSLEGTPLYRISCKISIMFSSTNKFCRLSLVVKFLIFKSIKITKH